MNYEQFVEKYCRWVNYYYGKQILALLEKKNYDCILWDNGCSAYKNRREYVLNKPLTKEEYDLLIKESNK